MDSETIRAKYLGCVVGAAIGDAVGAPVEFWDHARLASHPQGGEWIEDMLPFVDKPTHPLGVWRENPPRGTATDDTRLNQVFVEAAIKHGTLINSRLLAAEYVDRYLHRDRYYPGYYELATGQFESRFAQACGVLEIECPLRPGVPPYALRSGAYLQGIPSLAGLLALPSAGLLHPGDPEAAYRHAFELAYMDVGYARDATALLAAMVAAGFDEQLSPRAAIRRALELDPFGLGVGRRVGGAVSYYRTMTEHLNRFIDLADRAETDRALVLAVSEEVQRLHPYDPIDILGLPVAACYRADGDPRRAILMAVNDRDFDEQGEFRRFRDIDCTGSVCGALAGALTGLDAFPPEWVEVVVAANREVYGFDVAANARALCEVVAARRGWKP